MPLKFNSKGNLHSLTVKKDMRIQRNRLILRWKFPIYRNGTERVNDCENVSCRTPR
jgi:hypothetical protein